MMKIRNLLKQKPGCSLIPPLSQQILTLLFQLRTKLLKYSLYLDTLKNPKVVELNPMFLIDIPIKKEDDSLDEEQMTKTMFKEPEYQFINHINECVENCKNETIQLYHDAGRDELLSSNGIPESLTNFINNIIEKAQTYRDNTAISFREDIDDLLLLLNDTSSIVFNDLIERIKENTNNESKVKIEEFNKFEKESEDLRIKHEKLLRPELGSKNCENELNKLINEEENRLNDEITYIKETRKTILKIIHSESDYFDKSFFHIFETLLKIMDTMIYRVDFKPLPGDENIIPPRDGMKILMQLEKQKENGTFEIPERLREKLWNGLDKNILLNVPEEIKDALIEEEQQPDVNDKNKKGKKTPSREKPSPTKAKSKSKKQSRPSTTAGGKLKTEAPPAEEGFSPNIVSYGASCQRECVKVRNELYDKFCNEYKDSLIENDNYYKNELKRIDIWKENWNKIINILKNTSEV